MLARIVPIVALAGLAAFAIWRPVPHAAIEPVATSRPSPYHDDRPRVAPSGEAIVVYVAGAVKRPGLYHLRPGDRDALAVALAGGFLPTADAAGVNLAQRAADGDEVDVPAHGESHARSHSHRSRRRTIAPPLASLDLNAAGAAELAAVPGIGRAIAGRIVELRSRVGNFATLDELLDVAGMTQSRLDRARPYLREP